MVVQGGVVLGGLLPVAEAQTPRALPPSQINATPIEKPSASPQSHLKWRPSSKVGAAESQKVTSEVQPVSHLQLTSADGHVVQNASTLPPADPFNDPFNDQLQKFTAQQAEPPRSRFSLPQEPAVPAPAEPQPMATQPETPEPMAPAPMQPVPSEAAPMEEPPMRSAPSLDPLTPPRSATPLPPPSYEAQPQSPMGGKGADCGEIYKKRNCCEESENCIAIREELGRIDIRNISVDISSPFAPDEEDAAKARSQQAQAMQESPIRQWHNMEGELVAEGRMLDIRSRRISVDTGTEIKRIPLKSLGSDEKCFVAAYWNLPYECGWTDQPFMGRHWAPLEVNWTASALCHKPLYFEERALERYGHMTGPVSQVVLSGAHFFGSAALLPYQMGIHPPTECRYALGYYRPGNCAPYLIPPVPLSARGAAYQSAAILGAVYWIP
ncbi:hypothetical protein C5Y97_04670 [Blastopirellula marina]|uniref:SLA1 homology domain-containing protein n=1 Tax=Blastopirellula marina TaxID=124 RepID=A0A2S8G8U0_9BACT|nr:hypothetical protein C5Y98_04670 [Blastopirellula marina]PTL45758.1 hypothetical protein C5Y97_04670 [Blastopirellula marina]